MKLWRAPAGAAYGRPWCQRSACEASNLAGSVRIRPDAPHATEVFRWHTTLPGWKGGFESRRSLTASSFIGEDTALSRQKDGFDSRRGRLASPGIQSTVPEPASDIRWWCSWEHVALIRRRGLVRLQGSVLATGETGSHLSYKQEFRVRLPGCLRGRGCNGKPAALAPRAIPVRIWASPSGQLGVTDEHTRLVSVEVGVRIL
jgi:hypothetical protein